MPTTHIVPLNRQTLHGHFSPELQPAIRIAAGDTLIAQTLDANWYTAPIVLEPEFSATLFEPRQPELDDGHAMIGPVYIEGAKAGQTLVVQIKALKPVNWGWSATGGPTNWINDHFGVNQHAHRIWHKWDLDTELMLGRDEKGHTITLRPFLGLIGMPPPDSGNHSTVPPRIWGGNLDCKSLVAGSTLYLPIPVDGGLLSFGDGHAAQGDGEVSGIALECGMERVELQIDVRDDFSITAPVANTPDGWLTLALNSDLNVAAIEALDSMVALMTRLYHIERHEALSLASMAVDLRITQIANRVFGVHAVLPHGAIR